MKKTVKLLIAVLMFTFVCNVANADYIVQRLEAGVEKPSFEEGEYYVRTTPPQETTNYTTNNYYTIPYNYFPNTYRIIAPPVYYGGYYPYGRRFITNTGININIGPRQHNGIKPPPPPPHSNTVGPGGRYIPQTPQNSNLVPYRGASNAMLPVNNKINYNNNNLYR